VWISSHYNHGLCQAEQEKEELVKPSFNFKQEKFAQVVIQFYESMQKDRDTCEQLLLNVSGQAGSGKSYVVRYLRELALSYGLTAKAAAPTGTAAFNVDGNTLHSMCKLPINQPRDKVIRPLSGHALKLIQEEFRGVDLLIIDEKSMVSLTMLEHINQRLREARPEHATKPFGGLSLILMGDFAQLPPVGDRALFANDNLKNSQPNGRLHYLLMDKCIILDENMRQNGPEQEKFRNVLNKIVNGGFKKREWEYLSERAFRNLSAEDQKDFHDNAIMLCATNNGTKRFNLSHLTALRVPTAAIKAENNSSTAAQAITNKAGGLPNKIILAVGARVMLTTNTWKAAGLTNGAQGDVIAIIYKPSTHPPSLPAVVLVKVDQYIGPSYLEEIDKVVPIVPKSFSWFQDQKECTRTALPLVLSWAISIHKSQGMTLKKVCRSSTYKRVFFTHTYNASFSHSGHSQFGTNRICLWSDLYWNV
jgi:ATP-dependent DNA helicase PIF1